MQNQLAAIMFADIVGFSAMMEQDQDQTIAHVRALRSTHLEPVATAQGGRVLKRLGDGWIIAFGSISACVDCAMEIQTQMLGIEGVQLRIGCHFGDIVEDSEDIYGSGVNLSERIQSEAPPGGVMVSEDMARQLSGARAEQMKDAGLFRLKNIAKPVRLYQWRPAQQRGASVDAATSIAVAAVDYAPQDAETAAIAGDLRDQLFMRMSRRMGVVVYDASEREVENATYDLRSRLRVAGGRGRFSVTLVLRKDRRPVWSESYDHPTDDIFTFCDAVLEQADADLRLHTNAFDGDRLVDIPDDELSVSELRARAANLYYRVTYEDWMHGIALMERALAMNPDDGVALCMKIEGEMTVAAARYETMPASRLARMEKELDQAVEQRAGSDYVFWASGIFRISCLGDVAGAKSHLRRAREINPAYMEAHELEGHILMMQENFAGAADCFARMSEHKKRDPLMVSRVFMRAVAHYCAQDFEAAAEQARHAADIRPTDRMLHLFGAISCAAADQQTVAERFLSKAAGLSLQPSICGRCPVLPPSQDGLRQKLLAAFEGNWPGSLPEG